MKRCIRCYIFHEDTDRFCMQCGSPALHEVRYESLQVAEENDIVFRSSVRKRARAHATLGDVKTVHADGTITVQWRNRKQPQRMDSVDLRLTARYTEEPTHAR